MRRVEGSWPGRSAGDIGQAPKGIALDCCAALDLGRAGGYASAGGKGALCRARAYSAREQHGILHEQTPPVSELHRIVSRQSASAKADAQLLDDARHSAWAVLPLHAWHGGGLQLGEQPSMLECPQEHAPHADSRRDANATARTKCVARHGRLGAILLTPVTRLDWFCDFCTRKFSTPARIHFPRACRAGATGC